MAGILYSIMNRMKKRAPWLIVLSFHRRKPFPQSLVAMEELWSSVYDCSLRTKLNKAAHSQLGF